MNETIDSQRFWHPVLSEFLDNEISPGQFLDVVEGKAREFRHQGLNLSGYESVSRITNRLRALGNPELRDPILTAIELHLHFQSLRRRKTITYRY